VIKLDPFMTGTVHEFDRQAGVLAQEDITGAVDGGYESTATLEFVHLVGLDMGTATLAVNTVVDGREVADYALFGSWRFCDGGFGHGLHRGLFGWGGI